MRIIILLITAYSLQLTAQSGWWWKNDTGVSYEAETLAYQTRVLADGGEIINLDAINIAYLDAKTNDYLDSLLAWWSHNFGIKKNANNKVTKLYDLTSNDNDMVQSDTAWAPTWFADSLFYNADYMDFTAITTMQSAFWVITNRIIGASYESLLGDEVNYDLLGGGNFGLFLLFDGVASANALNGDWYRNGVSVNPLSTSLSDTPPILLTLIATGNLRVSNFSDERSTADRRWHGSMEELMLGGVRFSDTKRLAIQSYLNTKYTIY